MASKPLHAAWRSSTHVVVLGWMDMQGEECSGVVAHALATFPRRVHKTPDLQRVIPVISVQCVANFLAVVC
jgi:hypothetical protein